MIPIRDINPAKLTPMVTYTIIAASVLAFLYQLQIQTQLERFLFAYGVVPARLTQPEIAAQFTLLDQTIPFFTSMFLHGGWLHLITNMWVLYIFGDNVEGELGHGRYLVFYILCGLFAGAVHVATNLHSGIPTIGASGAIAGVMGAYFILYPRAKVQALVPIFFFFTFVQVPAYVFLGFWFILQFFSGTAALVSPERDFSGIAWWAHAGGFIGGVILLYIFRGVSWVARRST